MASTKAMTHFSDMTGTVTLDALWMPFTANKAFKRAPRLLVSAEGMYYMAAEGRRILDGAAGLWCVNAGHCREAIVTAIQHEAAELDYAPGFQMGHPLAFELASRLTAILPGDLAHVFFSNSGSEAVDTALKIALAYHHARGEASRTRFVGRNRAYHGVGFGGLAVGGIENNRKQFGAGLEGVDHIIDTHLFPTNAFSRGQPKQGAHLADDLERVIRERGADTIAAVIVEPVAGSTGVLIPPVGYLDRLREITSRHGILLIFDEVITGFGRLGAPFAADYFNVVPDIMTVAKGMTNGSVPMGGTFVREGIYESLMNATDGGIELFHGYTYSGHPLAAAAGLAALDVYESEGLFDRAASLADHFADAAHALRGLPHVIDIRNLGLVAAIELEPRGVPGVATRAFDVFLDCFEQGCLIRTTGDTIALSPPLIVEPEQIDRLFESIGTALRRTQ
jgi:beta-alanine--pyruvate transaminase